MDDEREATRCGKFGYEVFNGRIIIPYIFRGNEKCCATKMFSWHFERKNINLSPNLIDFGYLKGYEMHREEALLMNEINKWHNDEMYPHTFIRRDTLIKLEDVGDIFKYVDDCTEKLKSGTQFRMEGGSMVWLRLSKSKEPIVLPYVIKNSQRYVPVHILFTSNTVPQTLNVIKLTGIDVMYMRFLLDVLKIKITSQNFEIPCVNLSGLVTHLTANEDDHYDYDDNYWPSQESIQPKINSIRYFTSTGNNNSVEQTKIPMKRKCNSPNIEVKMPKQDEPVVISTEPKKIEPINHVVEKPKVDKKTQKTSKKTTKKPKTDDTYYEVDQLLDYKKERNGKELFLVRWKGYTSASDTWEPVSMLNEYLEEDANMLREKWARKINTKKKQTVVNKPSNDDT